MWDWGWDYQAVGDDAGPEPQPTDARWESYCRRCQVRVGQGFQFCQDCIDEFWEKARSYGDENVDRVVSYRRMWL